jgi:CMP-N-acetylneuraminic acid synthetase
MTKTNKHKGKIYKVTGLVEVIRTKNLDKGSLFGDNVIGLEYPPEKSIDIDEPLDLVKAELMMKELKKKEGHHGRTGQTKKGV